MLHCIDLTTAWAVTIYNGITRVPGKVTVGIPGPYSGAHAAPNDSSKEPRRRSKSQFDMGQVTACLDDLQMSSPHASHGVMIATTSNSASRPQKRVRRHLQDYANDGDSDDGTLNQ